MLEQQQSQLVAGLQATYHLLEKAGHWPGASLSEEEGYPLTHDILERLDLLHTKSDGEVESFEEDVEKLQERLISRGAALVPRRASMSSDAGSSHRHRHARSFSHNGSISHRSLYDTVLSSPSRPRFKENFNFDSSASSSVPSPQSYLPPVQWTKDLKPSPLQMESPSQRYDSVASASNENVSPTLLDWTDTNPDFFYGAPMLRSIHATSTPKLDQGLQSTADNWALWQSSAEANGMQYDAYVNYPQQMGTPGGSMASWADEYCNDLDFAKYVQGATVAT